jgi:hypothetical protein
MRDLAEKVEPRRGSEEERERRDEDADRFRNPRDGVVGKVPCVIPEAQVSAQWDLELTHGLIDIDVPRRLRLLSASDSCAPHGPILPEIWTLSALTASATSSAQRKSHHWAFRCRRLRGAFGLPLFARCQVEGHTAVTNALAGLYDGTGSSSRRPFGDQPRRGHRPDPRGGVDRELRADYACPFGSRPATDHS